MKVAAPFNGTLDRPSHSDRGEVQIWHVAE
jgi:hypothetical protein